jgi:hypothetical protein
MAMSSSVHAAAFAVAALHHSISIHAMHIGMNGFNLLFINHQAV